jgi:hypothetical protein
VRDVPKTKALYEQKILSLTPDEEWWYRKLQEGRVLHSDNDWVQVVSKRQLFLDYVRYMQEAQIMARRSNETVLGHFLRRVCPKIMAKQMNTLVEQVEQGFTKKVRRRSYHYTLPGLEECRQGWEAHYGPENWPDPSEVAEEEQKTLAKEPF